MQADSTFLSPRRAAAVLATALVWLLVAAATACASIIVYARVGGLSVLSVQSGSMQPVIRRGDAVLVRQGAPATKGSVISYRSLENPKLVITHRVVSIDATGGRIITKGDGLPTPDPAFGYDRVIGRVERRVPAAGYGLDLLRRPGGLAAAVYAPAVILITGEVRRLKRYYDGRSYRLHAYRW